MKKDILMSGIDTLHPSDVRTNTYYVLANDTGSKIKFLYYFIDNKIESGNFNYYKCYIFPTIESIKDYIYDPKNKLKDYKPVQVTEEQIRNFSFKCKE